MGRLHRLGCTFVQLGRRTRRRRRPAAASVAPVPGTTAERSRTAARDARVSGARSQGERRRTRRSGAAARRGRRPPRRECATAGPDRSASIRSAAEIASLAQYRRRRGRPRPLTSTGSLRRSSCFDSHPQLIKGRISTSFEHGDAPPFRFRHPPRLARVYRADSASPRQYSQADCSEEKRFSSCRRVGDSGPIGERDTISSCLVLDRTCAAGAALFIVKTCKSLCPSVFLHFAAADL